MQPGVKAAVSTQTHLKHIPGCSQLAKWANGFQQDNGYRAGDSIATTGDADSSFPSPMQGTQ